MLYFWIGEREVSPYFRCFSVPLLFALLPDLAALQVRLTKRSWEFNEEEIRINGSRSVDSISWRSVVMASIESTNDPPAHVEVMITDGAKIRSSIVVSDSDAGLLAFDGYRNKHGLAEQNITPVR